MYFSRKWPFGENLEWLCQLAHSCQGTPVFLSSMAIVAIGKYMDQLSSFELKFLGAHIFPYLLLLKSSMLNTYNVVLKWYLYGELHLN